MAKDAFYFSHDCNARYDQKIMSMRTIYGSEGYGWYWILIEMMREANGYRLQCDGKYDFHAIAKQMDCDLEECKTYISDCVNEFGLFKSNGVFFWSESLLRRMEIKERKSQKARESAEARWGKNANAKRTQSGGNAIKEIEKEIEKESKVKEKEKESHSFNIFWDCYDKKIGRPKSEKKWKSISDGDRKKIMDYIPEYIKAEPNKKFRKNPYTFLNQKAWEDEIVNTAKMEINTDEEVGRKLKEVAKIYRRYSCRIITEKEAQSVKGKLLILFDQGETLESFENNFKKIERLGEKYKYFDDCIWNYERLKNYQVSKIA